MFRKQKNFLLNSKTLRLIFIAPFIISIPFLSDFNKLKAGMEFQWDQNSGYKKLKWFQTNKKRRSRNSLFFFLRPYDRKLGLLKINIKIPKTLKLTLKEEKISLCEVNIGGFESRTKCIKDIPADIEINEEGDDFRIKTDTDNQLNYAIKLLNG